VGVLILAPKAAEEIRRKLVDSTDDFRNTAGNVVSKGREAVDLGRQAFEDVRETATEQGKDLYNQGRQAVSDIAAHSKGVS
jgi:gas vesicle protein